MSNARGTGQGARTGTGLGFAGAVALLIFGIFPENPGTGEPWSPEMTMAAGVVAMKLGEWLSPWFASIRPGMGLASLFAALSLVGCGHAFQSPGGFGRVSSADDAETACIHGEGVFDWQQVDAEGATSRLRLEGPGCYSWSRPVSDGATQIGQGFLELIRAGALATP